MQFFKRMEIHGFKSFANKTTIDFHPGVTVIVGPNGCGKSNVFDAIRWVLGEQSAKSLRGSRMGDVIFNGSGGQKAMGMSRVSLTLNNEGRFLPLDFDDVEIARRLFRTGESEYSLNKTQCRLKDITTNLMDTGIGTDSYSVLEQGKVDAIINSKPLERRAIFDEAAGISKYKARKDEALHKLNRTDDDLLRLADLINEVRRQCNSLKRQANKAERYKQLSQELKQLEMELLVRRYYAFRESSASSEAHYQELFERVQNFRNELSRIDEEQLSYRTQADELQQAVEETQALNYELNRDLQEVQGRIALLEQRQANSAERREQLDSQIRELDENAKQLQEATAQFAAETQEKEAELERLLAEHAQRKSDYETLKGDSDAASSDMVRLRQEISTATRARLEKENEVRVAHVMEEKLIHEIEQSDSELGMLREQIELLKVECDDKRGAAEQSEIQRERLREAAAAARDEFKTRDLEHYNLSMELEQARRAAHECQSRHEALADLQANFEGYYRGVKEVMSAGKRGELHGLVGVVSTLLEAQREHELAIEVALGSQAQDIVVDNSDMGKAAIRWLKESRVGRATFLPLDLIEGRENNYNLRQVVAEPGVVGFATDLVKYDTRIQKVVQYLLGNVVVVENLDVAVALERRGIRTKFVTLDGEMVSAHGAMTGGSVKATGLLNRTREVKELADRLVHLRSREQETEQRVSHLKGSLGELRDSTERLSREAHQQEIEAARLRKDFEVVDHRASEKAQQLERLETRRAGMQQQVEQHRNTQDEGSGLLEQLAANAAALEEQLQGIEETATAKQHEVAEAGRLVNELMIAISTGTERLKNLRERIASGEREGQRLVQAQADKRAEIERMDVTQSECAGELSQLHEQLAKLQVDQQSLSAQLTQENQRKENVHLDLRKLSEHAQVLQRDYNEAQNELHEVELKRTEYTLQLDNINVQAQEKFGLVLDDVIQRVLFPEPELNENSALSSEDAVENTPENPDAATADVAVIHDITALADEASDSAAGDEQARSEIIAHNADLAVEVALARLRTPDEIATRIQEIRATIDGMGPVHVGAIDEFNEANSRLDFLTAQEKDLLDAKNLLAETIAKIDETTKDLFATAFAEIRANFEQVYRRLFGGGRADLLLTEENGVLEGGIDIVAQPPGKKPQHISLLSGGEKALTAVALLFAIFMRKPSPFCILDEIDAPLDDKNIERFKDLVREFADTTQFIIITHNKQTMNLANTIYGVTMEEQGVSRVVSIKLDEIEHHEIVREIEEMEPVAASA
ncbi:MAG: chromosome segregation protein SMC [Candidatus Sumerlaeaceae bacterium]